MIHIPKYCTQCGGNMIAGKIKPATSHIDSQTGKPDGTIEYKLKCEKLKWFNPFSAYHDDLLVIDNPHSPIQNKRHVTILSRGY